MIIESLTIAAMLAPGIQVPEAEFTPPPEPVVVYVNVAHPADQCHEDEDWAAVHHETPGAVEDVHGVSRLCVNREDIVQEEIGRLVKDGTLIWEWDLPDVLPVPTCSDDRGNVVPCPSDCSSTCGPIDSSKDEG